MAQEKRWGSPLRVYCKNCGHPAEFNIEKQSYTCPACGESSGIAEVKNNILQWRKLQQQRTEKEAAPKTMYNCPSCGAQVLFPASEATQTCDFCGSRLVRQEFHAGKDFPELILPFQLTPEQAKQALTEWIRHNSSKKEAKLAQENMAQLKGYYLPFEIVRGPVSGYTGLSKESRKYPLEAFVDGALVNTSKQFDNAVLDGIEPFDQTKIRPFEYGYIAGLPVKMRDTSDQETEKRMLEEAAEEIRPALEKVFTYPDVPILLGTGDLAAIPLLLPVYLIKTRRFFVCVNGDTGRVAAALTEGKPSRRWVLQPLLITVLLAAAAWQVSASHEIAFMIAIVVGAISFTWASQNATEREIRTVRTSPLPKNLPVRTLLTPLFTMQKDGREIYVQYRFYTPARCLTMGLECTVAVLLPVILATLLNVGTEGLHLLYGAAWYCLIVPLVFLYFLTVVRDEIFNRPIIEQLLPGGGKKRIQGGTMFFLPGILKIVPKLGGVGVFLAVLSLFLLIGSVCAMLPDV